MNKLDLEETTRRFHNVYEQVAKEYGYKTREDTKELDFNSPNGMTMLKTVETITTPYLEEIERLNKRIEELENEPLTNKISRIDSVVANIYREDKEKDKEIERLHSIIKEVRDFANGIVDSGEDFDGFGLKLLEILDKENIWK